MSIQQQYARMVARAVARYKLATVPGRPEELRRPNSDRGVSFAYSGGEIRVRPMIGRQWVDELITDFKIEGGWADKFDAVLDRHFEKHEVNPVTFNHPNTEEPLTDVNVGLGDDPLAGIALVAEQIRGVRTRPIRDNPQA